ncbi:TetR/AcrR family transcriptional regulator, partial [Pseudomonas aeruginosa]
MVYRVTERRLQRDSALRERILQLGLRRVAEGGFAALTMQALADDAGIATGSLYRHFRGKGELAAEIFRRASQREVDDRAGVLRGPGAPAWRLAGGWRVFAAPGVSMALTALSVVAGRVHPEVEG